MRELFLNERSFFENLLKYSKRKQNGYYTFQPRNVKYGKIRYREHRVLFQLYFNVKLEINEIIHHIDHNKLNNNINNLQLLSRSGHSSYHHAGLKKIGKWKPYNKLSIDKQNKILKLSKQILKSNGKPNCSLIGKELNLAGFTVSKYINKNEEKIIGVKRP